MGVRAGATMCQLYELAGWEGGADELIEGLWRLSGEPFLGEGKWDCVAYVFDWRSVYQDWLVV